MRGIWTSLITPFDYNNQLDIRSFRKILNNQKDAGVAGVIPCGATGEAPTLSIDEKKKLIEVALEELQGSNTKVVASTGSNNTAETIELSEWASQAGVAGVLVVVPYYSSPSQAALEAHFKAIADKVDCEVVVYNTPGRTGVAITAQSLCNLAGHPRITAVQEGSGQVVYASEIMDKLVANGRHLDLLAGDDANFLPMLAVGAVGVVSVAANLIPRGMLAIQAALETHQPKDALKLHRKFYPLFRDMFIDSHPVPIKYAMAKSGWCEDRVRAPLMALSSIDVQRLDETLSRCDISKGKLA